MTLLKRYAAEVKTPKNNNKQTTDARCKNEVFHTSNNEACCCDRIINLKTHVSIINNKDEQCNRIMRNKSKCKNYEISKNGMSVIYYIIYNAYLQGFPTSL